VVDGSTTTLSWNCAEDTDRFVLRISDISDADGALNVTSRQDSLVMIGLEAGITYYWKVCPIIDGEYGKWSDVWSFTVSSANGAPVALSPDNGTAYIYEVPILSWTPVLGSTAYHLQVSTDDSFYDPIVDIEVNGTTYSLEGQVEEDGTYYWQVAGIADGERSEWSTTSTFVLSPETIIVTSSWSFYLDNSEWTLSVNVSAESYFEARSIPRIMLFSDMDYAEYVDTTDPMVEEIAEKLGTMAESMGYDEYTTACFVLSFVQNTAYETDINTTGYEEYPRYPIETIVEGTGDCEDASILFASLIQSEPFGMDAVLVSLSTPSSEVGHMAVGLYFESADLPGEVEFISNGTEYSVTGEEMFGWEVRSYRFGQSSRYYYCEATSEVPIGWPTDLAEWHYTLIPC
jgi:hypothetical protein